MTVECVSDDNDVCVHENHERGAHERHMPQHLLSLSINKLLLFTEITYRGDSRGEKELLHPNRVRFNGVNETQRSKGDAVAHPSDSDVTASSYNGPVLVNCSGRMRKRAIKGWGTIGPEEQHMTH